tara:strand:+ start:613 stop:1761 length:1149 start_codon:yes stop_codon:yes gene_type:complete
MAVGGLKALYNLILKDAIRGSGGASGIMSIGDSVRALAQKRFQSYVMSAQKQGVDLDRFSEGQLKYMLEMNKAGNKVKMKQAPSIKKDNVIEANFGKPFREEVEDMNLMKAIEDASPGFANDIKVDAELVAENLAARMGKVYDDLPTKERLDFYDKAYTGLSKQRFKDMRKPYDDDLPEDMADGGRIGFKKGMDRRTFMKIMGGLTALPVVGKFFKGAEVAAPVVEKAVDVASGAPPYFFNLVDRIRALGKKFSGPKERSESYSYKDYQMDIDLDTGKIDIKKTKEAMIPGGDEAGVAEEVYMTYKPGVADETTKGKKVVDEYEEFTARPDIDGKMKDVEDGVPDEVVREGSIGKEELEQEIIEQIAREKKASGGLAYMLGE